MASNYNPETNKVFESEFGWHAMFMGRTSSSSWNSWGAAQAWLDICIRTGEFRS
jgi:hypothetical protein